MTETERRDWAFKSFIGRLVLAREKNGVASLEGIDNPDLREAFDAGWVWGSGDAARVLKGDETRSDVLTELTVEMLDETLQRHYDNDLV